MNLLITIIYIIFTQTHYQGNLKDESIHSYITQAFPKWWIEYSSWCSDFTGSQSCFLWTNFANLPLCFKWFLHKLCSFVLFFQLLQDLSYTNIIKHYLIIQIAMIMLHLLIYLTQFFRASCTILLTVWCKSYDRTTDFFMNNF